MNEYFDKNRRWLNPVIAGFIVCMTPLILSTIGQATPIPLWVSKAAFVLSVFLAGFGAMMTDTTSAKVIRYVGFSLGIGGLLYFVFL